MTTIALTGAHGFLGWHTRSAAASRSVDTIPIAVGDRYDRAQAVAAVAASDRIIHIAGVNRADDDTVVNGNIRFASQLAEAVAASERPPASLVFANSTQVGNGSPYAEGKAAAADILGAVCAERGIEFVDVRLPNLFGEHGRPFYNSVVATFSHLLSEGGRPTIETDREMTLLHAQDAADVLLGEAELGDRTSHSTVSELLERLTAISSDYRAGTIPDLADRLQRDLFNTYRSFTFSGRPAIPLTRNADARGSFFEVVRSRGGEGQTSFSTTVPGVTRGQHFHRRKVERFTVLSGHATIALRQLFTDEVLRLEVSGDEPVSVDMPTMWTHNITNTGTDVLYTTFWSNEIFDPSAPDTYAEEVQ